MWSDVRSAPLTVTFCSEPTRAREVVTLPAVGAAGGHGLTLEPAIVFEPTRVVVGLPRADLSELCP